MSRHDTAGEEPLQPANAAHRGIRSFVIFGLLIVGLAGIGRAIDNRDDDRPAISASEPVTITFDVSGTATWADVTMTTSAGTEQFSPDVPMTNKHTGRRGLEIAVYPGDFVYISAQNNTELGTITCTIRASDGSLISRSSSTVDFGIATCDGVAR